MEYHRKNTLETRAIAKRSNGGRSTRDPKQMKSEESKVRITVSQDGSGNFTSVRAALDSIPKNNSRRVVVEIKPGFYREKILIPQAKPFITLLGDVNNPPTITGNDTASVAGDDGTPLKTFHSATVAINADYFIAANIRFENTAPEVGIGTVGGQAVALRISGDKAAFYNCSFYGTQDTLYDHKGLHYFNNCFIQGSVDFIFGYGRSLYENCVLNSIANKVASLTAQKRTNESLWSGFSFTNGRVTGTGKVYLGRAWGDYSRVVFSYTFMDKLVLPQGWNDWGQPLRHSSVYYGEYQCSGPGANSTGRVTWARLLTYTEVKPFLGTYYIDGNKWLPLPQNIM
ncbi:probable pectinesterase 53 [Aristolochia californica]|uniref:probable pectinesterase 53 n=1 Tax=Aristolochia californica TaxID=171875 RepID=UPI0035D6E8E9